MAQNLSNSESKIGLANYKAISLLGRPAINKLIENGLVVISARELANLQADLHSLTSHLEVLNQKQDPLEKN